MIDQEKFLNKLKNDPNLSKVLADREKMASILNSDDAKKLMEILNRDGGAALKKAAEAITSGDAAEAKRILEPIIKTVDTAELVNEINRKASEKNE